MRFILFFLLNFIFSIVCFGQQTLIIEPEAGRAPLLNSIQNAHTSVNLIMYGLTDPALINALISAKKHGKSVEILLEPKPYRADNENDFAFRQLRFNHITPSTTTSDFKLTHQKTLLLDQTSAFIMTFNFTRSSFDKERNFAIVLDDPGMIREIEVVFKADIAHRPVTVNHPDLVWSPNNSREKILGLINSAEREIKIYAQGLTDYQVIGALAKAARSGKNVEILLSNFDTEKPNRKFEFLKKAGVKIHFSQHYLIHAKVILVDQQRALLGSVNFTRPSMNDNRELSIITKDPEIVKKLNAVFDNDWSKTKNPAFKIKPEVISKMIIRELKKISRELLAS